MPFRPDRLREVRERKKLTQRDLARLCGVTEFQISRYETGKSDTSADTLELLARYLEVSADYLLGLADFPNGQFSDKLFPEQVQLLEAYETGDSATIMELAAARMRQLEKAALHSEVSEAHKP